MLMLSYFPGNVTRELPGLKAKIEITREKGVRPHHSSFTQAAATPEAFDRFIKAGKAMALSGWTVLTDDSVYQQVV